jgi:putative aldouronate transport system substrate-binding protein
MKRFISVSFLVCFCCALALAAGRQTSTAPAGGIPGDRQPFGKYNPPITVYSTKTIYADYVFEEGDTVDDNPWSRYNHDELGIDVKWKWIDAGTDREQKMTAAIASNDLPDIFEVNTQQYYMLAQSGLIWDLTDIYETYASPLYRSLMDSVPLQASAVKINDRMYALPRFSSDTYSHVLWARQDWIEKLNLPNPTSVQNVVRIAEAFAKNDPDGNGKDDTIGLLAQGNFLESDIYGRLTDFFIGYHAYPDGRWLKDSAGNLVNGVIQPEVKTALTALADLYSRGIIDREFVTRRYLQSMEDVVAGRAGLLYGAPWLPLGAINAEIMNPGIKLVAYPTPSADSRQVSFIIPNPVITYFVVNKKYAHPEALLKLMNLQMQVSAAPPGTYNPGISVPHSYEYFQLNIVMNDLPKVTLLRYNHIHEAFETGDTSALNAIEDEYYHRIIKIDSGEPHEPMDWAIERIYAKDRSSHSVMLDYYEKNGLTSLDPYLGPPTETQMIRQASLDALRDEVFTKIIIGELPISAFDTFVQDWKRQGGDKITEEVNAWYRANR